MLLMLFWLLPQHLTETVFVFCVFTPICSLKQRKLIVMLVMMLLSIQIRREVLEFSRVWKRQIFVWYRALNVPYVGGILTDVKALFHVPTENAKLTIKFQDSHFMLCLFCLPVTSRTIQAHVQLGMWAAEGDLYLLWRGNKMNFSSGLEDNIKFK